MLKSVITTILYALNINTLFSVMCFLSVYKEVHGWPSKTLKFGQIAAVTVDHEGTTIIFHRGDHVWNEL